MSAKDPTGAANPHSGPGEPVFIDTSIALTSGSRIGQAYAPAILEMAGRGVLRGVSDAIVLQEIADWGRSPLLSIFWGVIERVFEARPQDWKTAAALAAQFPGRAPRIYLHVAVMQRYGVRDVYAVSGAGYEGLPGVRLLPLTDVEHWQDDRTAHEGDVKRERGTANANRD